MPASSWASRSTWSPPWPTAWAPRVETVNIPFNGLFSAVQSGRIDIATSSITITDERLESVTFAQPYYDSDQSLTALAEGPKSLAEMKDKVVGVDTGSTGDMWATENQAEYGFADIRRYEGLAPAMLDLQAGRIDGYVSDIPALQYYVKDKPQLAVVERIPTGEKYSMMFAKDAELATEVNTILDALKTEGVVAELHEKWFGVAPMRGRPPSPSCRCRRSTDPTAGSGPVRTRRDAHGYLRHLPERRGDAADLSHAAAGSVDHAAAGGGQHRRRGWCWAWGWRWRGCTGPARSGS